MIDINKIDFKKGHGLVPVIAQDVDTQKVLMMGYANEEAIQVSQKSGKLTFFSRSKNRQRGRKWKFSRDHLYGIGL